MIGGSSGVLLLFFLHLFHRILLVILRGGALARPSLGSLGALKVRFGIVLGRPCGFLGIWETSLGTPGLSWGNREPFLRHVVRVWAILGRLAPH